jgi:aminoglycoside 2''-phosphotransferase
MSATRARAEIERSFPELAVREIDFLGAGVDSEAYLVNDALVFRFPKREAVSRALSREIALLPKLAERLPVAVPRFEYVGQQASGGRLFVGYPLIPGEPLTSDAFEALAVAEQEAILDTLAAILRAVHTFPMKEAVAAGVEPFSARDWVRETWTSASPAVLRLLSPADVEALAGSIERFLADEPSFDASPCLLYADFAPEHVLYDPSTRALTGLIDWGDLTIGDPAFDLLYLYQDYGEPFVGRLLNRNPGLYTEQEDRERLLAKVRAFNACDYLRDIAGGASGDDLSEAVDAVVRLVKGSIEAGPHARSRG